LNRLNVLARLGTQLFSAFIDKTYDRA